MVKTSIIHDFANRGCLLFLHAHIVCPSHTPESITLACFRAKWSVGYQMVWTTPWSSTNSVNQYYHLWVKYNRLTCMYSFIQSLCNVRDMKKPYISKKAKRHNQFSSGWSTLFEKSPCYLISVQSVGIADIKEMRVWIFWHYNSNATK